jgi:hypothetical protein
MTSRAHWRNRFYRLSAASLVLVAAVVPIASAHAAAEGYQRQSIREAKVSILIPDDWTVGGLTRREAKRIAKDNPDLDLEASDFTEAAFGAAWDGDGDEYPDRWMDVNVVRGMRDLPSPDQAKAELDAGLPEGSATTKRGSVAGKAAIVTTFRLPSLVRDDGSEVSVSGTQFIFIGTAGVVIVGFYCIADDTQFEPITKTMIRSVKLN